MRVTRTLHHSVNVEGRLTETVAFYRRLLEMPDEARPAIPGVEGHWFWTGTNQLHLVDADAGSEVIQPTGPHVCFAVADLGAAVDELDRRRHPVRRGGSGAGRPDLVHRSGRQHRRDPTGSPDAPGSKRPTGA